MIKNTSFSVSFNLILMVKYRIVAAFLSQANLENQCNASLGILSPPVHIFARFLLLIGKTTGNTSREVQ